MINDEQLVDRVNAEVAVDRVLNDAERTAFDQFALVGQFDGADPADWIAEAQNADKCLPVVEGWWNGAGEYFLGELTKAYRLPEEMVRQLLNAALYATCAIASATLGRRRRSHIEIAGCAALWVLGYAEAIGWERRPSG